MTAWWLFLFCLFVYLFVSCPLRLTSIHMRKCFRVLCFSKQLTMMDAFSSFSFACVSVFVLFLFFIRIWYNVRREQRTHTPIHTHTPRKENNVCLSRSSTTVVVFRQYLSSLWLKMLSSLFRFLLVHIKNICTKTKRMKNHQELRVNKTDLSESNISELHWDDFRGWI